MKREYRTIDKSAWGAGPWQDEPDKVSWTDEGAGLPCLAVRQPSGGFWCGYVGVAEGHPAFGKDYEDIAAAVHGGLTFSDHCSEGPNVEQTGICHIPEPGQPDRVWWCGFDCAHGGDLTPARTSLLNKYVNAGLMFHGTYRTLAYVQRECADLALQLAEMVL